MSSMCLQDFSARLDKLYAIFGKSLPDHRITEAIYRRVEDLPAPFMDYAISRLQDLDRLPANLGAYLRNDLWPDYRATHPEQFTRRYDRQRCPRCKHDQPGIKEYWEPDGTPRMCACDCCMDGHLVRVMGKFSDDELGRRGYLVTRPATSGGFEGRHGRHLVQSALRGAREPARNNNMLYLEQWEDQA